MSQTKYKSPKVKEIVNIRQQRQMQFLLRLQKASQLHIAEMRNIIETYPPCSIKEDDSTYGDRIMHNETY